jgi:hypothetical protein
MHVNLKIHITLRIFVLGFFRYNRVTFVIYMCCIPRTAYHHPRHYYTLPDDTHWCLLVRMYITHIHVRSFVWRKAFKGNHLKYSLLAYVHRLISTFGKYFVHPQVKKTSRHPPSPTMVLILQLKVAMKTTSSKQV